MTKSFCKIVALALVAMSFVACSSVASCDSSEVKNALAESIKQMVGDEVKINYDSFSKIPIESYEFDGQKRTIRDIAASKGLRSQDTTFICEVEATVTLHNKIIFRDIIKYAPQYDYDNKMYVKITYGEIYDNRFDNSVVAVAIARSDLASAQKAIVAKVFADSINAKAPKAPNPDNPSQMIEWGEWIIKIAGLDTRRWKALGNGIYPIDKISRGLCYCRDDKFNKFPLLWINTKTGSMHFNPNMLYGDFDLKYKRQNDFCSILKESYRENNAIGFSFPSEDKIIPLVAHSGAIEF